MSALVTSLASFEARERLVDNARTQDFAELIRIAGLDPKKHLRFADWSGVDFSGSDLRGFDFTGAKLIGCNFKEARIERARFDQALIDEVRPGTELEPGRTNLWAAKDWERFVKSWKRADKPAPEHLPPGSVFQDAPFAPEMVVVPQGRFWMGSRDGEGRESERPRHEVTIPQAFAIGRVPLTFDEWDAARAAGGVKHEPDDNGWGRGRRPVINVSWTDAEGYVAWLSRITGKPYRLLSEAEWEYACRAGTETVYSIGDTITSAQAHFFEGNWGGAGATVKVASFPANNFGLFDMHGNVWEWCEDRWHEKYAHKPDGLKQTGGAWISGRSWHRVLRGGYWQSSPRHVRAAIRVRNDPSARADAYGFRLARALFTS
jgi:formylglycine-generating enzyme required for sulfatase activity